MPASELGQAPPYVPSLPDPAVPFTWGGLRDLLNASDDAVLAQAATLFVLLPDDLPAGAALYLPVGGVGLLEENVFDTPTGLCPASALTADEFRPGMPVVLPIGQLVLTNVQPAPAPPDAPVEE